MLPVPGSPGSNYLYPGRPGWPYEPAAHHATARRPAARPSRRPGRPGARRCRATGPGPGQAEAGPRADPHRSVHGAARRHHRQCRRPSIQTDLGASGAALQLVVAGYTIAYAVLLITGARLGERLGYGRVFQHGLLLFTFSSLACGLAPDTAALIGFRVAQGVGAALMVPQVMSLIQRIFSGASRVRALSVYTAVLATGGLAGQVLGGCWSARTCWAPAGVRSSW
ncbi:MFS transporter [Streptacidiphilus sp. 4-A2]|nr:MFS transporter [Streptacidiphilus sp. 4-A2]